MWQYTSKGTVPGISGWVDMNIAYFNYGTVAAPKHTHDYNEEVKNSRKEPTCGEDGSKVMACSCGEKETVTLKATGKHTWGEWKVTTEATADKEGIQTRICSVCKKEETKDIEKTDENTNTNTNTNTGTDKDTNTSTNTNLNTNTSGSGDADKDNNTTVDNTTQTPTTHTHNFVETSRTNATCTSNGTINYKCSDSTCTETDSKTIEATGHSFENGVCKVCQDKDPNYVAEPEAPDTSANEIVEGNNI